MDTVQDILCDSCREIKPLFSTDIAGREFCQTCYEAQQPADPLLIWKFLMATIPFRVGDRVKCYTAGRLYDGIGTVDDVSMDPANYGTPVYPSFHVTITEKAYDSAPDALWYTEICLRRVNPDE